MLREGYIRLNLQSIEKYNKRVENRHIKNMKKVNELKEAYIIKANQIKKENEKIISERDNKIVRLKSQVENLKKQRALIQADLNHIPQEIIAKYNEGK